MSKNRIPCVLRLFPLCVLLVAGPALGQMIPLEDLRVNSVHVLYYDGEDYKEHRPAPFGFWENECTGIAEEFEPCESPPPDLCQVGYCSGLSYQISQFYPAGIQFSVATGAGWVGPPAGHFLIRAVTGFKFRIDNALDYDFFCTVDPGDSPIVDGGVYSGVVQLMAHDNAGNQTLIHYVQDGMLQTSGRLGPGTYTLEGWSGKFGAWESFQGPVLFAQWTVTQPQAPAIAVQPPDRAVACGGTVVFSVGTTLAQSNYTFQWRRNFVPLTNGPGVSGATTSTLTLTNVCSSDDYDVVVTGPNPAGGGTIAEPSRLAHLGVVSPTGVDTEPTSPASPVVRAAAPNPFRVSTSIGYDVRQPTRLSATVYNAAGAKIRSLADRTVTGPGTVTWDGRLRSGARAPVGIYFLRVEVGDVRETRKVVLLE